MKWTVPQHGSSRVTTAGKIISGRKEATENLDEALAFEIAANWRSAHGYPLQVLYMTLRNRAKKIDRYALLAQRLKRMPSIVAKLRRFHGMQLSQMQDLGGCRAVLSSVEKVDELVAIYENSPLTSARLCEKYDHISIPKSDGYRGVHLVYKYDSRKQHLEHYNGLRIEMQIRSRHQHAWATALETIDTFTSQGLKSGLGDSNWKRFFVLASSFIARFEYRPAAVDINIYDPAWLRELHDLLDELKVIDTLEGLRTGLDIAEDIPAASAYILVLDSKTKTTQVHGFHNMEAAARAYQTIELQTVNKPHIQAVQVSVESVAALHDAYPNYYLDTENFITLLRSFKKTAAKHFRKGKTTKK
jgi:hypothetical protein